jgi:hypothetical protein
MLRHNDYIEDTPTKILAQACTLGVKASCASVLMRRITPRAADPG